MVRSEKLSRFDIATAFSCNPDNINGLRLKNSLAKNTYFEHPRLHGVLEKVSIWNVEPSLYKCV